MRTEYMFSLIIGQLLKATPIDFDSLKESLDESLSQDFEMNQPRRMHALSVAAESPKSSLLGLWNWLNDRRAENARMTRVLQKSTDTFLPDSVKDAFANGTSEVYQIMSKEKTYFFEWVYETSQATSLTGSDLEILFDAQFEDQSLRDQLWSELLFKVVCFMDKYEHSKDPLDARKFLRLDYEKCLCPADQFLSVAQDFCRAQNLKFKIPDTLKHKLQPKVSQQSFFPTVDQYAPFFSVPPTGSDLVKWIDAQPDADKKWKMISDDLCMVFPPGDKIAQVFSKALTVDQIRHGVLSLTDFESGAIPIGNISIVLGADVLVPEELKSKFIFPERPPVPDDQIWVSKPNDEKWEMLVFRLLHSSQIDSLKSGGLLLEPLPLASRLLEFRGILQSSYDFFSTHLPPFKEPCRLAVWLLDNPDAELTTEILQKANFSQVSIQNVTQTNASILFEIMNFPPLEFRAGLVVEVVNLMFGGMGSLSDQKFESQSIQSQFADLTKKLFEQLTGLRSTLCC